jgi:hypothetical protein
MQRRSLLRDGGDFHFREGPGVFCVRESLSLSLVRGVHGAKEIMVILIQSLWGTKCTFRSQNIDLDCFAATGLESYWVGMGATLRLQVENFWIRVGKVRTFPHLTRVGGISMCAVDHFPSKSALARPHESDPLGCPPPVRNALDQHLQSRADASGKRWKPMRSASENMCCIGFLDHMFCVFLCPPDVYWVHCNSIEHVHFIPPKMVMFPYKTCGFPWFHRPPRSFWLGHDELAPLTVIKQ